jgi:putative transposase
MALGARRTAELAWFAATSWAGSYTNTRPQRDGLRVLAPFRVRTVRAECLDWMLILGRRHLDRVLRTYVEHYNGHRVHRALGLAAPLDDSEDSVVIPAREVRPRNVLGGLIHEYHRMAA